MLHPLRLRGCPFSYSEPSFSYPTVYLHEADRKPVHMFQQVRVVLPKIANRRRVSCPNDLLMNRFRDSMVH